MARTVGGGVRAEIALLGGEEVRWQHAAQRKASPIAAGGKLFLTDRRLLWAPNWYFARLGMDTVELSLGALTAVEELNGRFDNVLSSLVSGGADGRFRVETADGRAETWASSAAEEATERIRTAIAESDA